MANDLSANPLRVDTTATAIRPGPVRIKACKHIATGANSVATITDTAATTHTVYEDRIVTSGAASPLDILDVEVKGGFDVTINAGTLYVYLDDGAR